MTLEAAKMKFPDAVDIRENSQTVITEEKARELAYGKKVDAKCLFKRTIPTSRHTVHYFIFSKKALEETTNV